MQNKIKHFLFACFPLVLVISLVQILLRLKVLSPYLVPYPIDVLRAFLPLSSDLWSAAFETFASAVCGLTASLVLGLTFAIVLSLSDFCYWAFYPYAIFFQTVPVIAIAPLLVIWFGFGQFTVIVSSFIVSIFPIFASGLVGLRSTDPDLLDLFRLYRVSKFKTLWKLRIPHALPQIFSGLRIASGLAVIGVIAGEFIAGGGLGSIIDEARTQQKTDKVFAAVLAASLAGLALTLMVDLLSKVLLQKWHASERPQ